MKLKRWQQYSIAISVAWMIGVISIVRYQELPKAQAYAMRAYFVCAEHASASGSKDLNPCLDNVSRDWDAWMNRKWRAIAIFSLLPVAAGWLAAFAALFLYKKRKGRQAGAP